MRYVLLGAGAVGSALGGLLALSGNADVLLVGRGDHAQAMLDHGPPSAAPDTAFRVHVEVTTSEQTDLTVDDVLVLTTKTQQSEAARWLHAERPTQWVRTARASLRLRPVRADDEAVVRAAQVAIAGDDFVVALELDDDTGWARYVERLAAGQRGDDVPVDRVPASFLLADVDGVVVGRTSIRHRLNDFLRADGGHIGYGVLPAFRRQGYATEMLRQSLVVARAFGVERALLTCDDDNVASATVIERCGGILDPSWPRTTAERPKRRYWID